eukprot:8679927-Pyramimonas_sp.AAC.1
MQTSHPTTRNVVCETHVAASAMSAWRWLVRFCGRASPRMRARVAASWSGAADVAAEVVTAGHIPVGTHDYD